MLSEKDIFSYQPDSKYSKAIAYFSMEFAIDPALQIYSGGLGFLAGSHIRSAFDLKQNFVGVGMLWKYGYYDQVRDRNQTMKPAYTEKDYSFLTDMGILFSIPIHKANVFIKVFLLKSEVFGSAPLFLLSTDVPENDYLSRTITERLYDPNEATRVAQSMVLGIGGAKLMDELGLKREIYHLNEGHGLPLCFYLYSKLRDLKRLKEQVVFTTHTPEKAGNEDHEFKMLEEMSFFYGIDVNEIKKALDIKEGRLDYTLAALKMAKKANGVSKIHGEVAMEMWKNNEGVCDITSITNAQNKNYWKDEILEDALLKNNNELIQTRKKELKKELFKVVAAQCGKLFDENVLTMVWARRFAGYKRPNMLMWDYDWFKKFINNVEYPVQMIWAGKPYPEDYSSISIFNDLVEKSKPLKNCAVLTGYDLSLSALLKKGSDVWLNNPRMYREASGTSGMTAAMNASINVSIPDGWVPEFAKDSVNGFVVIPSKKNSSFEDQDAVEHKNLIDVLENKVVPLYYDDKTAWANIIKQAMIDIVPAFDSSRMADEYYSIMY